MGTSTLKYKYAAYYVAIKDDFCLEESIVELRKQGVDKVLIVSPTAYWSTGEKQSSDDFYSILKIASKTASGVDSVLLRADRKDNCAIYTEALYRNHAIELLLREYAPEADFILTVDADELWTPGTLEHVDSLAEEGSVKIDLPGIPVAGAPGLPVEGATDVILTATSRDLRFAWGRSIGESPAKVKKGTQPILHFSATRRTREEVAAKMRQSAHYIDPTYDFEGWIKNTLPHTHVGMQNVHMYKTPVNIWPALRAWTAEELTAMPSSLKPYLDLSQNT